MGTFSGFICDRCGKEFRTNEKDYSPVAIRLSFDFGRTAPSMQYSASTRNLVWCRGCVMLTGVTKAITENDKKAAPETELTFEEKLAILIEDMGFTRVI